MHFIFVLSSFFMGAFPFGFWISKKSGVNDIRAVGSGNIGATNVTRVAGFWPAGFFTFLLDSIKGFVLMVPIQMNLVEGYQSSLTILWFMGFAAVLGHCFTPWLKFQGGKGVATGLGVLFFLAPITGAIALGVFAIAAIISRTISIASLSAFIVSAAFHPIFYPTEAYVVFLVALVLLVIYRHESNLDALIQGSENRF